MKIWIFNHYAQDTSFQGPTRHFDLGRELILLENDVTIICSSFNHFEKKKMNFSLFQQYQTNEIDKVKFIYIKNHPYKKNDINRIINMVSYFFKSIILGIKIKDKPDIIIGSLMHPLAALSGLIISKIYTIPFIFEERDLWPQTLIEVGKYKEKSIIVKFLRKLEGIFYNKSSLIIVLFEEAKEYVISKGIHSEKILVLSNGVNLDNKKNLKLNERINSLSSLKLNNKLLIYAGSFGPPNYLEGKIKLARELINDPIHIVLIGEGVLKESFIKQVMLERLDNITVLDSVPKQDIYSLLEQADMGLIMIPDKPIYKWGISPNKIYDYMASGLPIAMLFSNTPNIVEKYNIGIVSNNEVELANKLKKLLLNDQEEFIRMKKNIALTLPKYTWSNLAVKLNNRLIQIKK